VGLRLRFGIGPLRASVPLTGGRKRKRRKPAPTGKPTFHANVRLPDGSHYTCHHAHRTQQAAVACAERYQRSTGPQARPVSRNNASPKMTKPDQWWPRAGWGTIRGLQVQSIRNGRANLRFYFVPDDGSQPQFFDLADMTPLDGMGEYARGVMRDGELQIKVDAETMRKAEQTFQGKINRMHLADRKTMFADRNSMYEDAGWSWTPDYKLVKAAPGLVN
jgi:hypothetical protein